MDVPAFKTRPNYFILFVTLIGLVFFGFLAKICFYSPQKFAGVDARTGNIIILVFAILFLTFSLGCLISILFTPVYQITGQELLIRRPFLLQQQIVKIIDIISVVEKDVVINISRSLWNKNPIYKGKRAVLLLDNGTRIKIRGLQVVGYRELIKRISKYSGLIHLRS